MDKENTNTNIDLVNIIAEGVSKALKDTQIRIINESKTDISVVACARTIRDYCKSHRQCTQCIFMSQDGCLLKNNHPEFWDVD